MRGSGTFPGSPWCHLNTIISSQRSENYCWNTAGGQNHPRREAGTTGETPTVFLLISGPVPGRETRGGAPVRREGENILRGGDITGGDHRQYCGGMGRSGSDWGNKRRTEPVRFSLAALRTDDVLQSSPTPANHPKLGTEGCASSSAIFSEFQREEKTEQFHVGRV